MKSNRHLFFAALITLAASLCLNPSAHAQATRTWVSGVGDDANPCSRTAPCKTFAGAISKTAASGEISVLDPGGYGAVTITKAMTIDGDGTLAGILSSSTYGVTVNAASNDVVTIRNVSINGGGSGTFGIRIVGGGTIRIENCSIQGGAAGANGIDFQPTIPNTRLVVLNTRIYNFGGTGIFIKPSAAATDSKVEVEESGVEHCGLGISADTNVTTVIKKSFVSQNFGAGVTVAVDGVMAIEDTLITQNGLGISSTGNTTISGVTVTANTGAGLTNPPPGSIKTYHNNKIFGNNPDGNPSASLPLR